MYWYLAIMLTSATGMAAMLAWRIFEIKKKKVAPFPDGYSPLFSMDEFRQLYAPHVSRHKENVEKGIRYASSHCFRLGGVCIASLRDTMIERRLAKLVDAIRGKQDMESGGGTQPSSFLRSIVLHKQKLREQTDKNG